MPVGRVGSPRRLLGAKLAPLVQEKRRPRRRRSVRRRSRRGCKGGAGAKLSDAKMDSGPLRRYTPRIASLDKRVIRKIAPRRQRRNLEEFQRRGARGVYGINTNDQDGK